MATQTKDFYRILDVAENATPDEIKKSYRKLAKQYHPDANASDAAAAERFKEISEAYSVLSDDEKRKQYDQMRKLGAFGGFGGGFRPGGGARPGPGGAQTINLEDLDLGGSPLGDIFGSFFDFGGKKRAGGRPGGPERGENIEYMVEIPFRTAVRGGKVTVQVPVTEECASCHGSGAAPGATVNTCPECKGSGTVTFGAGGFGVSRPCPMCGAKGRVPSEPCPACRGAGQVRRERAVQVTVPAGVDTGSKLRLAGQGERGASGGQPGDLVLTFRVEPDRFFSRDALDLNCTIHVNLAQAVLGSKVKVRTVDGPMVVLKVPPGTQPGRRFRIKGMGVEKAGRRGDQFVKVQVDVPETLDEPARKEFEEFAAAAGLRH
ncbi:MAG TPA: J domain-containing protein [Longimicrobium sp.]|jgi:molecular chaperone DnaJ|uniref:J domain-containing protein n=1 Tax=Longimicrobium sp. TaxID=2029185 RepID=UPI002EDB0B71